MERSSPAGTLADPSIQSQHAVAPAVVPLTASSARARNGKLGQLLVYDASGSRSPTSILLQPYSSGYPYGTLQFGNNRVTNEEAVNRRTQTADPHRTQESSGEIKDSNSKKKNKEYVVGWLIQVFRACNVD